MIDLPPPQKPDAPIVRQSSSLMQALGDREKLRQIKQRENASYPPPNQERKKVYSSNPTQVNI